MLADLELTPADIVGKTFYHGRGCDACNNTGYKGRVGLFELMIMNDDLRDMIMRNASTDELRDAARSYGMVTLRDAGMNAVYEGTHHAGRSHSRNRSGSVSEVESSVALSELQAATSRDQTYRHCSPKASTAMPTYQFEAMDSTGQEIKDVIEAASRGRSPGDDPPDGLLRHQDRRQEGARRPRPKKPRAARSARFAIGGVSSKVLTTFTRQLSILQDAGLPILRSLRILEGAVASRAASRTP